MNPNMDTRLLLRPAIDAVINFCRLSFSRKITFFLACLVIDVVVDFLSSFIIASLVISLCECHVIDRSRRFYSVFFLMFADAFFFELRLFVFPDVCPFFFFPVRLPMHFVFGVPSFPVLYFLMVACSPSVGAEIC